MTPAIITIESATISTTILLGLPVIVRTIKACLQAGCCRVILKGRRDKSLLSLFKKFELESKIRWLASSEKDPPFASYLSGSYYYDPDFIHDLVSNNIQHPEKVFPLVSSAWFHPLNETQPSFWQAEKKAFEAIRQKTKGWIAPVINKPVSFLVTRFLLRTKITPNQITVANLILAMGSACLLMSLSYPHRLWGAVLMQLSSILDGCDGEVARLKLVASNKGAWLDTIADDVSNNFFFLGLTVGLFRSTHDLIYWKAGGFFLLLSFFVTGIIYHQLLTQKKSGNVKDFEPAWKEDKKKWLGALFDHVRPAMKRDFFIFILFLLTALDFLGIAFWLGACGILGTFFAYVPSFFITFFKPRAQRNSQ